MPASNGLPSITEIYSFTRIISAAELLAFAGGLIEVVPAPGDGKIIWPISFMVIYNFNTVDFDSGPDLAFQYGSTGFSAGTSTLVNLTGGGASKFSSQPGISDTGSPGLVAGVIDVPINVAHLGGAFALAGVGAASIGAAGTGYAVGDTGTITTGGGDATYLVTSVGGLGDVTGFVITFPGHGYAVGNGQATATGGGQPGVGINFTVDVNSLVNGDGSIKVTTLYQVIDVP